MEDLYANDDFISDSRMARMKNDEVGVNTHAVGAVIETMSKVYQQTIDIARKLLEQKSGKWSLG